MSFVCMCKEQINNKINYIEHVKECELLKIHKQKFSGKTRKPVQCGICKKDCSSAKYFLNTHLNFHAGKFIRRWCYVIVIANNTIINKVKLIYFQDVKPIKCTYGGCQYRFAIRSDLLDHINKIHTFKKPYQCEYCGQSFATRSERSSHKRVHIAEKRFHCTICRKSFARSSVLKTHIRVHTGDRPYKCSICQQAFTQSSSLKKHVTTHKSNQSEQFSNNVNL